MNLSEALPIMFRLLLIAVSLFCGRAYAEIGCPGETEISIPCEHIVGSDTIGETLVPLIVMSFAQDARQLVLLSHNGSIWSFGHRDGTGRMKYKVESPGTTVGFKALRDNTADVGMASDRMGDATRADFMSLELGDMHDATKEHVVALDSVRVLVNPKNPLRKLTIGQLHDIFAGKIRRWSEIDLRAPASGPGAEIMIAELDRNADTHKLFTRIVLGGDEARPNLPRTAASQPDVADEVFQNPGAIGYVGIPYGTNDVTVAIETACGRVTSPDQYDAFLVRTEEYPLSRRLFLYTTVRTSPMGEALAKFATGSQVYRVVTRAGFINLEPEAAPIAYTFSRLIEHNAMLATHPEWQPELERLRARIDGIRRVSTTFQFESANSTLRLDSFGEQSVERLIAWTGQKQLVLIGHSSLSGPYDYNIQLSKARAVQVRDKLVETARRLNDRGFLMPEVDGVGPVAPVVCDNGARESEVGLNRRVEVWVR